MPVHYFRDQVRRALGLADLQDELARTANWTRETAKQIALIREIVATSSLGDENLLRTLEELANGEGPIVVGPWLSEVGFELLYWIPFLQWFVAEFGVNHSRVVVISRGGVASWYANVAKQYYEIFDRYSVEDFRAGNGFRMSVQSGSLKQNHSLSFDHDIIEIAKRDLQLAGAKILHPSIMYSYFQPYWAGMKPQRHVLSRLRFMRLPPVSDPILDRLPERFVATKFYLRAGSTPQSAALLLRFVSHIARDMPVVAMDAPLSIDEHEPYRLEGIINRIDAAEWLEPAINLHLQTAIVSKANALIGTYGGFTYLPMLIGKPSIGIIGGKNSLLGVHGNIMYSMAEALDGSVTTLHTDALELL